MGSQTSERANTLEEKKKKKKKKSKEYYALGTVATTPDMQAYYS